MIPDTARVPVVQTLAIIAIASSLVQPVLNVAFVFIQPERSPLSEANSDYALGRLGWLWQLGAMAAGIGLLAAVGGLRMALIPGRRVPLFLTLLAVAGASVFGTGVFISGNPLHLLFGLLGISTLIVGTFVARGVFARDPRWQPLAPLTRAIAWWNVVAIILMFVVPVNLTGLVQRLVFLPGIAWGVIVALRLYRLGPVLVTPPAVAWVTVNRRRFARRVAGTG